MPPELIEDSSEQEAAWAAVLDDLCDRVAELEAIEESFAVSECSLLGADDRATAYDPVSYQVQYLMFSAFDNLRTLCDFVRNSGMPTVAGYALRRSAIESAGQAVWLLSGGTRKKRVTRTLHRVWNGAELSDRALSRLDASRPSNLERIKVRLSELLTAAGCQPSILDRDHPSMTNMMIDSGRRQSWLTLQPVDVWRLCSSMTHGNRSVALVVLERRGESNADEVGANYVMTTSYRTVALFVRVTLQLVEHAIELRSGLNAPGRIVQ